MSAQAPNFNVSLGQVGEEGGGWFLGWQGPQALENVEKKRRDRIKMVAVSFSEAMATARVSTATEPSTICEILGEECLFKRRIVRWEL